MLLALRQLLVANACDNHGMNRHRGFVQLVALRCLDTPMDSIGSRHLSIRQLEDAQQFATKI
jgi:hypothetical protein